jgi:hypothetical protein
MAMQLTRSIALVHVRFDIDDSLTLFGGCVQDGILCLLRTRHTRMASHCSIGKNRRYGQQEVSYLLEAI